MINNTSIIIMYKKSSLRREKNLLCVLNYLKDIFLFKNKIIVVEQDLIPTFDKLSEKLNIEYYFQEHNGSYNKSKALNYGAIKANTKYLIFNDCDIVMEEYTYNFCLKYLKEFEMVSPYSMCFDLSIPETDKFYLTPIVKVPLGRKPREGSFNPEYTNISGGCMMIRRDSFWSIGGWDEEFSGWGGEDDAFNHKIKKCLKYKVFNNICLHLWHEKNKTNHEIHKNDVLVKKYREMKKEEILELGKRYATY